MYSTLRKTFAKEKYILPDLDNKASELNTELTKLDEEINILNNKVAELDSKIASLNSEIADLDSNKETKNQELDDLKNELLNELITLSNTRDNLQKEFDTLSNTRDNLQTELENLEKVTNEQIDELKVEKTQLENPNEDPRITELNDQIGTLNDSLGLITNKAKDINSKIKEGYVEEVNEPCQLLYINKDYNLDDLLDINLYLNSMDKDNKHFHYEQELSGVNDEDIKFSFFGPQGDFWKINGFLLPDGKTRNPKHNPSTPSAALVDGSDMKNGIKINMTIGETNFKTFPDLPVTTPKAGLPVGKDLTRNYQFANLSNLRLSVYHSKDFERERELNLLPLKCFTSYRGLRDTDGFNYKYIFYPRSKGNLAPVSRQYYNMESDDRSNDSRIFDKMSDYNKITNTYPILTKLNKLDDDVIVIMDIIERYRSSSEAWIEKDVHTQKILHTQNLKDVEYYSLDQTDPQRSDRDTYIKKVMIIGKTPKILELLNTIESLQTEITTIEEKISNLINTHNTKKEEESSLESTKQGLNTDINNIQTQIDNENAKHIPEKQALDNAINELNAFIPELESIISNLNNDINNANLKIEERNALESAINDLKIRLKVDIEKQIQILEMTQMFAGESLDSLIDKVGTINQDIADKLAGSDSFVHRNHKLTYNNYEMILKLCEEVSDPRILDALMCPSKYYNKNKRTGMFIFFFILFLTSFILLSITFSRSKK